MRKLSDWIEGYMKFVDRTEPPLLYHKWTAISAIAGALQRKVWIQWGRDHLYPNFYIILIGPSGKCRKGTAMKISIPLLRALDLPLAPEAQTRESLIKTMGESRRTLEGENMEAQHSSLTVHSEEFGVFMGNDPMLLVADLCDWYDCKDKWEYRTKTQGTDNIFNLYLNMLGATTPDWLQQAFPAEKAVGVGLTSRIIFVVEWDKRQEVDWNELTPEELHLYEVLWHDLQQIHLMAGEYTVTDEVREMYRVWYTQHSYRSHLLEEPHFQGYMARRATHLKKLLIVLRASRGEGFVIEKCDLERALSFLTEVETNMTGAFKGVGSSPISVVCAKVLDFMLTYKKVPEETLRRKFMMDADARMMDLILETLMKAGQVTRKLNSEKKHVVVINPGAMVEKSDKSVRNVS